MSKVLTNHDIARKMLEMEEKPVYSGQMGSCQGEYFTTYSEIIGLNDDVLENAYVLDVAMPNIQPNDTKYKKGEAIVFLKDNLGDCKELSIDFEDMIYMLFENGTYYYSFHVDYIRFYNDIESNDDYHLLESKVKIAVNNGFHPEWVEFSIDEAKNWYLNNFKEYIDIVKEDCF